MNSVALFTLLPQSAGHPQTAAIQLLTHTQRSESCSTCTPHAPHLLCSASSPTLRSSCSDSESSAMRSKHNLPSSYDLFFSSSSEEEDSPAARQAASLSCSQLSPPQTSAAPTDLREQLSCKNNEVGCCFLLFCYRIILNSLFRSKL
jgi:hypothetical protein